MTIDETLLAFEAKYPFLYEIEVNGFPVYTCLREALFAILTGANAGENTSIQEEKGRVYPGRILDSLIKLRKFSRAETLVFTSAVFRRDFGRNLAAEYLIEKYPNAVVFEWPSRTDAYDSAYFSEEKKNKYCPLDFYLVFYKSYKLLHKKEYIRLEEQCRERLLRDFEKAPAEGSEADRKAVSYLMAHIPEAYAATTISQQIFRRLFSKYKNIKYAIDFWGGARENIIPVLPGNVNAIELQHGIIAKDHTGYIYPQGADHLCKRFFDRTLLVYGEATKQLLVRDSVFRAERIEVIGNPRVLMYKEIYASKDENRKMVLFTSQPFEKDGIPGYYQSVIPILKAFSEGLPEGFSMGVKLHPRENDGAVKVYKEALPKCEVYDNASPLFELLSKSYLHITVSSTTLYEAALFGCPTVCLKFGDQDPNRTYGFEVWSAETADETAQLLKRCFDREQYEKYLGHLIKETRRYM